MSSDEPVSISLSDVEPLLINDAALRETSGINYALIWMPALGLILLGGLIWAVVWYLRRKRKSVSTNDPDSLFRELCTAHSLTRSQRKSLLKLAQLRKIANPCLVVLDAGLWPEEDDPLISRSLTNKLSQVRRCLFEPMK